MRNRLIIRIILTVLMLSGISGYALFESRHLLAGPVIKIEEPTTGVLLQSPVTFVKGQAHNIVRIKMNDRDITVDEKGVFNEKLALSNGNNVVKVSAEDRFGRSTETFVEIFYTKPPEALVKR